MKTTESGGRHGFDAAKLVKGRKRHIVTDTGGLLVAGKVHGADIVGLARQSLADPDGFTRVRLGLRSR